MNDTNTSKVVAAIRADLSKLKSPTVPDVRKVLAKFAPPLRKAPGGVVLKIARELATTIDFPPRLVGFEILAANREAFALMTPADIECWAAGLCDWGGVDLFGCTIVGQAWRTGIITDRLIRKWAMSPDRWLRRLSLVASVPLNNKARGGLGDAEKTLMVCALHLDDRDDMVVKAMSWALRELAKRDPKSVQQFVKQHRLQLANRILREVNNKLVTGLKNPK